MKERRNTGIFVSTYWVQSSQFS